MSGPHHKMLAADPEPFKYENEIYARGLHFERPPFTFNALAWEDKAKERLAADAWGYVYGSAGTRETHDKNRAAFQKWSIVPSRLVKTTKFPDLKVKVFGEEYAYPIACAPVGVQKIFNPDGEIAAAKAAGKVKVPYILSTASSTSIEDVAKVNEEAGGQRWYQLYWPSREHDDITISLLGRAKKAGYTVLVVTLDTYILGWRPSDMDNGYNPFLRPDNIGVELGFSDPVFQAKFKKENGKEIHEDEGTAAAQWAHMIFPGFSNGWEDTKFLQEHWDGPIILKGIQSVADAKKCVEAGVQGIVVSNHGGRQLDGGVASLDMLPKIVDAVGDELEILFDSGARCGADIAKALALGAKMVLIGRPYIYGLALGGEDGVTHVLRSLLGDLDLTLHLSGLTSVGKDELNRDILIREA